MVPMPDQVRPEQIRVIIQMRTPVAAGVVAAIRRRYPASVLSPGQLRDLLRDTAEPQGDEDFDYEYGHGIINVQNLLDALEEI
jgi:Subtilase family